jgi:hypothetical protein
VELLPPPPPLLPLRLFFFLPDCSAIVVECVVGAATVLVGVPTNWRRKRTMEASTWCRGQCRQRSATPKFPIGFPLGRGR